MAGGPRRARRSRRSRRRAGSARRSAGRCSTTGAARTPASRIRPSAASSDRLTTTRCPASAAVQVHATRCSHDRLSGQPSTVDRRPRPAPHARRASAARSALVPRRQVVVGLLGRTPAERHRHPHPPADLLALVDAAPRRAASGRRPPRPGPPAAAATRASRGSSWFSTKRTVWRLVRRDRRRGGRGPTPPASPVHEAVVEPLVVAGVEALLDERAARGPSTPRPRTRSRGARARTAPMTVGQ